MAARILALLVIALALVGGGYWWGHTATDNAWQAKQRQTDQAQAKALDAERQRADGAAANYLQEHLDQESRYAALDTAYENLRRRVPLVVPGRGPAPGPVRPSGDAPRPGAPAPGPDEQPAPSHAQPAALDGGPVLTLAAVRMWNGALHGRDQAAGACGLAAAPGGADAACAQGSGLTLDDAWANHRTNAMSCAADRLRLNQLIDYLSED